MAPSKPKTIDGNVTHLRRLLGILMRRPSPPPKPRVRINKDGWVRHDGKAFPFGSRTPVEVIFLNGDAPAPVQYADYWPAEWWTNTAKDWRYNIRWWRIVSDPVPPIGGRR